MPTPWPTAPGTASVRFYLTFRRATGGTRGAFMQFNFVTSGSFPGGYTSVDFNNDSQPVFVPWLNALWNPFVGGAIFGAWGINFGGTLKTRLVGYGPGSLTTPHISQQIGIGIMLRTANGSRNGRARFHFPITYPGDFDGSAVSSAGVARINSLLAFFVTPFTIAGMTFAPCVWSRQLASFIPITHVTVCPNSMYLRKRRPTYLKAFAPVAWPTNW